MNHSPSLESYAAIGVTILMVLVVIAAMLVLAHVVGPSRHGPVKDSPYESGMPVSTDARRRLHIRALSCARFGLVGLLDPATCPADRQSGIRRLREPRPGDADGPCA